MRKKILQLIVVLVALCQMQTFAQTARVTGKVIGPDNNPVPGASVTVDGTNQGTVTDADGNFAISAPSGSSLLISSVGNTDQVVKISGRSVINVTLQSGQTAGLNEVVVTGYQSQKRKDIIGSVSVVDVKALKAVPSSSAMGALQGQASGVTVVNNGAPGQNSQILIRGVTGVQNQPLVLIDGIQGNINDVPAIDVESIQVLKDAGAAAIYGARGANGVIIITTKKGKSGAPSVVYDSYYNMQFPRNIDKLGLLNTEQYASIYSQLFPTSALFAGGSVPDFSFRGPSTRGVGNAGDAAVDPNLYKLDPKIPGGNYIIQPLAAGPTYYDEIMSPALMMNHNISASGGNDRVNYLLSLGYLDHDGTLENSTFRRYNARVNTQVKINDKIRIGENLNIHWINNPNPGVINGAFGPIESAIKSPPFIGIYDIAGNFAGPYAGPINESGDWGNAVATVKNQNNNKFNEYAIQGNVFIEADLLRDFTVRSSLGGTIENFYRQLYTPRQYWAMNGSSPDQLEISSGFNSRLQFTNTLNYRKEFGDHSVSAYVGTEAIMYAARNQDGQGNDFFLPTYNYLVLNAAVTRTNRLPRSGAEGTNLASYFGGANYAYKDRYLLGVTARRDGFSEFGPNNRYGNFYSVSAGWRVSQEEFMKNVSWVNDLKVRGSYGVLGNNGNVPIGNSFSTFRQDPRDSYYDITGSGTSTLQGFYPQKYGNASTSWEENKQFNIGFDATLFNNKLDFSIEYYKKSTDGLLYRKQLSATAGEGASPVVNLGNIENKGVDINAVYRARVSKDVGFTIGANFTTYKNEVVSIPDPGYVDDGPRRIEEGYPYGSFFGYKVLGVFKDQKDVDDHAAQPEAQPGRWKYLDANGDDTITTDDRIHYANANPKFTLGINLGATFKNFDFQATIYTAQGQSVYNGNMEWLGSWERGISNKSDVVLNAWSESNPNGTWKKAEFAPNFSTSGVNNSAYVEDGSFIRLRNIQLGYTIGPNSLKKIGLTRLRFFVGGTNLFLITNYSGLDPEIPEGYGGTPQGVDAGGYSQQAGVVAGLTVGF